MGCPSPFSPKRLLGSVQGLLRTSRFPRPRKAFACGPPPQQHFFSRPRSPAKPPPQDCRLSHVLDGKSQNSVCSLCNRNRWAAQVGGLPMQVPGSTDRKHSKAQVAQQDLQPEIHRAGGQLGLSDLGEEDPAGPQSPPQGCTLSWPCGVPAAPSFPQLHGGAAMAPNTNCLEACQPVALMPRQAPALQPHGSQAASFPPRFQHAGSRGAIPELPLMGQDRRGGSGADPRDPWLEASGQGWRGCARGLTARAQETDWGWAPRALREVGCLDTGPGAWGETGECTRI